MIKRAKKASDEKKIGSPAEEMKLETAVNEVLRTPEGRRLWVHLFRACGYNVTSLTRKSDGDVSPLSTECKEAQRLIYINLRQYAAWDLRRVAEEMAELPVVKSIEEERKN